MAINRTGYTHSQTMTVLTSASIMLTLSMGMRQSFGLFVDPMTKGIDVTVADVTLALGIQNLVWGLSQPLIGALADRFGCRVVTVLGTFLFAGGLALTLAATGPALLIVGLGPMVGVGLACTALNMGLAATAKVISPVKRTMILGTVAAAGSIGTFIAAPIASRLIGVGGWELATIGFIVLCGAMLPAAAFVGAGDRPMDTAVPVEPDRSAGLTFSQALGEAGRHRGFVIMAVAFFVCGLQLMFVATHLPNYLAICGQPPELGAISLAVIGGFNAAGCFLLGWLGDKFPKHILLGTVYILRSLLIVAYFMLPPTPATTVVFAALLGLLWLGVAPLVNGLVVQMFGLYFVATLSGVAFFSHQVGSFFGAWGGGLLFDAFGNYDLAWQIGVAIGITAGIVQMFMDDTPTRRMAGAPA